MFNVCHWLPLTFVQIVSCLHLFTLCDNLTLTFVDQLTNMQLDRAQLEQTVNDREEQLMSLETTLEQRQQMLTESNKRINAVEEEHARTQKQVRRSRGQAK